MHTVAGAAGGLCQRWSPLVRSRWWLVWTGLVCAVCDNAASGVPTQPVRRPGETRMTVRRNLFGCPGSGKTRVLRDLFIKLASQVGPEHVGAVTYTRAGASVLRERVGAALGLKGEGAELARKIPWVGTIHSMALKLSGASRSKIVDKEKLKEFAPSFDGYIPSPEYMDTLSLSEPGYDTDEVEAMLWCLSASRHRMIDLEATFALLDPHVMQRVSPERILGLVQEYQDWKQTHGYLDFEDMLIEGRRSRLPVKALLVDEVQDNTPLLYSVLQSWETNTQVSVFAGDPWQAIFSFAGASPNLFLNRPGEWTTIGNSHRFDQPSADYARRIIEEAYGTDPRLHTWEGVGGQEMEGGTAFYLARTRGLVSEKANELIEEGIAFRRLGGTSPLQQKSADVYRDYLRLRRGESAPHTSVVAICRQLGSRGDVLAAAKLPSGQYRMREINALLGDLDRRILDLPYYEYYAEIERRDGELALFRAPKLTLGTIHSAKGLEADHVTLCESWATRPAANLAAGGLQAESTIAYVACTRHRVSLTIEPSMTGSPYPFP